MEDSELDASHGEGEWSIRQVIEHVLYWDRDSIDDLVVQHAEETGVAAG